MNEKETVCLPYEYVAEFADGTRQLFPGLTESAAFGSMEAAMQQHGDVAWWDGVTDLHYENGKYRKLQPAGRTIINIDLTEYDGPVDENGLPPFLTGKPPVK